MKKLARYNHYDPITRSIDPAQAEKKSYIVIDVVPVDYTDVTSISQISENGEIGCSDYLGKHFLMKDYFYQEKTWATLTDEEKMIVIDNSFYSEFYEAGADANKIGFLMSPAGGSMTLEEAVSTLIKCYSKVTVLLADSCVSRASGEDLMNILGKYLKLSDALDLSNTVRELLQDYKERGLIGTDFSDVSEAGLTDYLTSKVGTIYENTGLSSKGYLINAPYTLQEFIDDLLDLFVRTH
jgi:hypothetical protein